jgi:8-oxo-dGTP diphosphatase
MTNKETYRKLIQEARASHINKYSVGAVIAKNSEVLLLKRPTHDFMGGIYELPGGKVKAKETLKKALYREVKEETGLVVKRVEKFLGYFDYKSESNDIVRQFNFYVSVRSFTNVKLREHENYIWIRRKDLRKYPITKDVKHIIDFFLKKHPHKESNFSC